MDIGQEQHLSAGIVAIAEYNWGNDNPILLILHPLSAIWFLVSFVICLCSATFCRALDPVILHSAASQAVKTCLVTFLRSLSTVLTIAYISDEVHTIHFQ
uniref:Mechanosensitive channel protein 2/3 transmembrane domain-containing protein n=1 Tax=Oryza brachyantha TaxID=4533 RepID=J3LQ12_ORYBR